MENVWRASHTLANTTEYITHALTFTENDHHKYLDSEYIAAAKTKKYSVHFI